MMDTLGRGFCPFFGGLTMYTGRGEQFFHCIWSNQLFGVSVASSTASLPFVSSSMATSFKLKCKPSAPSARVLMRQDTACIAASYTIRWDTGPCGVYLSTEPVSRRLAASAGKPDCTSTFPRCDGQLVAKGK